MSGTGEPPMGFHKIKRQSGYTSLIVLLNRSCFTLVLLLDVNLVTLCNIWKIRCDSANGYFVNGQKPEIEFLCSFTIEMIDFLY